MTTPCPPLHPSLSPWMLRGAGLRHPLLRFGVLLLLLLMHMPLHGIMSTKEEVYYAQAERIAHPERFGQETATHPPEPVWRAFYRVAGPLVEHLDGENTQRAGRILGAVVNAAAVAYLAGVLGLSVVDLFIIVSLFILALQSAMGQEWLWVSFEPKALAYPCVIMAMAALLRSRTAQGGLWLAAATVFHIYIGFHWTVILAGFLSWEYYRNRQPHRHPLRLFGVWLVASSPYLALVGGPFVLNAIQHGADAGPQGLTANSIYSFIIDPIHVAPFKDLGEFSRWDQGIGLSIGILLVNMGMARSGVGLCKSVARIGAIAMAWLLLALVCSFLDKGGALGKFDLYRPSSLGLLLTLMGMAMYITAWLQESGRILKFAAVALLLPVLIPHLAQDNLEPILDQRREDARQAAVRTYLASQTLPQSTVLLHPRLDDEFLWLERVTYHPTIVNRRNTPDTPQHILDWHAMYTWRAAAFENGCVGFSQTPYTRKKPPDVDYMLLPRGVATGDFSDCATPVFEDKYYVLYQVGAAAGKASNGHGPGEEGGGSAGGDGEEAANGSGGGAGAETTNGRGDATGY